MVNFQCFDYYSIGIDTFILSLRSGVVGGNVSYALDCIREIREGLQWGKFLYGVGWGGCLCFRFDFFCFSFG